MGVCKVSLSRARSIFSENFLAQEIEILIKAFGENEHKFNKKLPKKYMNNITFVKEKVNIEAIKND